MARTKQKPRSITGALSCHYSGSNGELHVLQRLNARRAKRLANVDRPAKEISTPILQTNVIRAPAWRPVQNPDATFLGLPAEVCVPILNVYTLVQITEETTAPSRNLRHPFQHKIATCSFATSRYLHMDALQGHKPSAFFTLPSPKVVRLMR
jgi:hypothetical protein